MPKREKDGFDWRFLIIPVIFVVVCALAVGFNVIFDGESVAKVANNITVDNGDEKINWGRYATHEVALQDGPVKITKPGTYHLTGDLFDGGVELDIVNTEVKLILDNVTIINPTGPAIYCGEGEDVVIELIGESYVEDGVNYVGDYDERTNGTIYINADLTFIGDGSLTVVGNKADGIVGKDDLKFLSGAYIVRARDDGIRGTDSLYIKGGDFRITAKKDALKSTDKESNRKGFVLVEGGNFRIDASGKGIEAFNVALIRGGELEIKAYEGIEARTIAIDGGKINILALDDGLNAKSDEKKECLILIDGGEIYVDASGDGIDANGRVAIAGGRLVIDGPTSQKHGALDADDGVAIKGGEIITLDTSEVGATEILNHKTTKVPGIDVSFSVAVEAGTEIKIYNTAGEAIIQHIAEKRFTHLMAMNEKFVVGEQYEIWLGGKLEQTITLSDIINKF